MEGISTADKWRARMRVEDFKLSDDLTLKVKDNKTFGLYMLNTISMDLLNSVMDESDSLKKEGNEKESVKSMMKLVPKIPHFVVDPIIIMDGEPMDGEILFTDIPFEDVLMILAKMTGAIDRVERKKRADGGDPVESFREVGNGDSAGQDVPAIRSEAVGDNRS